MLSFHWFVQMKQSRVQLTVNPIGSKQFYHLMDKHIDLHIYKRGKCPAQQVHDLVWFCDCDCENNRISVIRDCKHSLLSSTTWLCESGSGQKLCELPGDNQLSIEALKTERCPWLHSCKTFVGFDGSLHLQTIYCNPERPFFFFFLEEQQLLKNEGEASHFSAAALT